jgi:hypothetical protein
LLRELGFVLRVEKRLHLRSRQLKRLQKELIQNIVLVLLIQVVGLKLLGFLSLRGLVLSVEILIRPGFALELDRFLVLR